MRVRTIKPWWLIAAFLSGLAFAMAAEELILSTQESRLEFSAPRVHFLVGKPLERLRNASEVPFDFKITLWSGTRSHMLRQTPAGTINPVKTPVDDVASMSRHIKRVGRYFGADIVGIGRSHPALLYGGGAMNDHGDSFGGPNSRHYVQIILP